MSINKKINVFRIIKNFLLILPKQLLMIFMVVIIVYPIYFVIVTSFKTKMDYISNKLGLPHRLVFSNYITAFQGKSFALWLINSAIVTVGAVTITTLIAALAAFSFSRIDFAWKEKIFNFIISLMAIPPAVMVIPLFIAAVKIHLVNTYFGAILIYSGMMLPFSVYLLRNFFVTIPQAIVDSALIDGCSRFKAFVKIILPLSIPALITLIIVNALWVWNELFIALIFLQKTELKTLMVGLTVFRGRFKIDQPVIMAGVFVSAIPMILLYLFGQRFFIKGMTTGSLKGE